VGGLEGLFGGDLAKSLGGLIEQFEGGSAHQVPAADAAAHHDAVAKKLSPQDYEKAAIDAASKLTPEQRKEVAAKLTEAAKSQGQGHTVAAATARHHDSSSAEALGKLMGVLQNQPGGVSGLLSGGASELLGNAAVRSALVGVAASAAKSLL
jgi:hypothetical protein